MPVVGWLVVIIVGLMTSTAGAHEVRTVQPVFPRLGPAPGLPAQRHGWLMVACGGFMVLFGLSGALGLPRWVDLAVLVAALGLAGWALVTHQPVERAGRTVDPPEDPDSVWKRNPPGY